MRWDAVGGAGVGVCVGWGGDASSSQLPPLTLRARLQNSAYIGGALLGVVL